MILWEIINKPFILTIIALIWGSLVTNYITSKLSRHNKVIELRLKNFESIFCVYQKYVRIIKSVEVDSVNFSEVHSELVGQTKVSLALYKNNDIFNHWTDIYQRLSNIHSKQIKDKNYDFKKEIEIIFDKVSKVMPQMIKEIK